MTHGKIQKITSKARISTSISLARSVIIISFGD